jgi:hypothetical protein
MASGGSGTGGQTARGLGIRLFPSKVEFQDVVPGVTYVLYVTVKNTSTTVKRVRFTQPTRGGPFRLLDVPSTGIAPGLDAVAEIEFNCTEKKVRPCAAVASGPG